MESKELGNGREVLGLVRRRLRLFFGFGAGNFRGQTWGLEAGG